MFVWFGLSDAHNASASLAGYLFQCRLALLLGLRRVKQRANGQITIEKFDDIAFETNDYAECLIQAKHHVTPKTMSDGSVDIWKTLRIWITEFKRGALISPDMRFVLITTSEAEPGSAMSLLRPGRTEKDVQKACELLTAAAGHYTSQGSAAGREAFLSLSPVDAEIFLGRIDVLDLHSNLTDVRSEIEGELLILAPDHISELVDDLEGWWFATVAEGMLAEKSAAILLQNIVRKAHDIGGKYKNEGLKISEPEDLEAPDYTPSDEQLLFVKQMRAVALNDRSVRRGVRDFYRASAQRSKWAREALLLDGETAAYDAKLIDRFERHFDERFDLAHPTTNDEKTQFGREMCHWASQQAIAFRDIVEAWITSGSFHALADRPLIGWHPDHVTLFPKTKEDSDD
ncbi:hypothetical protein DEM26_14520 [Thioclava sp. NG1]|uniref:ABC-three component system protein n=1 Tax=Thioclava sp. NG1 TaxID=2182426 RepID=UPI000D621F1F|nr:ABC-three component system protein [Thioclava sp. NG1]PWE49072.1 hypothetical protein DEM26_14520 [Thioclava sp. NG1]